MKQKVIKRYKAKIELEKKIHKYMYYRDEKNKDGTYKYNIFTRLIASLCFSYYIRKWERWYD